MAPTPVLLPGKSHGWSSLEGYSPWVAKSQTWLSDFTFTSHLHALEKEMATHSSVLAWRIPGMGEPGGLPSMGSHRVRHDWSDLAVAAAGWKRGLHHYLASNDKHLQGTRSLYRLSNLLCAYWSGTWTRVVLVIPPNNKESQSQYQNATRMQMPFLSDHMLTTHKTWEFQRLLFAFSEECPLLPSLLKRFLHTKSKWCEFALVDIFSFCVLLTDWHLLSC